MRAALALVLLCACKGKASPPPEQATPPRDAITDEDDAPPTAAWPELADYPIVDAVRTIALPNRQGTPRFEVGGPVVVGDIAVVASSQFGFLGVDWRGGQIAWSKPAGAHVAPPVRWGSSIALVGDCLSPPAVPDGEVLLACLRVVTPAGVDEGYVAVHGTPRAIGGFAAATGPQALYAIGDTALAWQRGDHAVVIDPTSGLAKATPVPARPPVVAEWEGKRWDITHESGRIVARQGGKPSWSTAHEYTQLLGIVHLHQMSPLLRIVNQRMFRDQAQIHVHDIDAMGSMRGTFAKPLPGIALLGWDVSPIGDAALAVRLDTSLRHDFVAAYAATAQLLWVYPLPNTPRPDPVGVAMAEDAVVVFHDGDTLTVLPEVSAPATAPGAGGRPSGSATP